MIRDTNRATERAMRRMILPTNLCKRITTKLYMKKASFIISLALLAACSNDNQKAAEIYAQAEQYYQSGDYKNASIWIDSIEGSYPKAFDVIRNGMILRCKVNQKSYEHELLVTDSLYNAAQNELDALKSQFDLTRESEYQTERNYIYKKQRPSQTVSQSELRAQVTEKGEFRLISIYHGNSNINHTGIRIELPDGSYSESATIGFDGAKNYRYADGGKYTEMVTYNLKQCKSVVDMIAGSGESKLKVRYTGGKNYVLSLDRNRQQAIAETYRLSQMLALADSLSKRREYGIKQLELADTQLQKLEQQSESLNK